MARRHVSVCLHALFTGWCCRTPRRCAPSCTTPPETCARTSPRSPPAAAWSRRSAGRFYPARRPEVQKGGSSFLFIFFKITLMPFYIFLARVATFEFLLTSWFSWNNTRYSERCCRMNFLMTSCLMRGSNTLATRQASRSTLLGPTDLCAQTKQFKVRHWFRAKQGEAGEDTGREWWPWIPGRGRPLQNLPGSESPTRSGPPSLWQG